MTEEQKRERKQSAESGHIRWIKDNCLRTKDDGTEFVMEYDGVLHYAIAEYGEKEDECYMLLLDENKNPYYNSRGEKIGYYRASSQAGIDAVNIYRKKNHIENRIDTLNGPLYWKTNDGVSIKSLIDSL